MQHWRKTSEGLEILESEKLFCLGGTLWMGNKKTPYPVQDSQATIDELSKAIDVDGTMQKVWFKRRQRLGGRHQRKSAEYNKRRAELRDERSKIRQSMKEDVGLGIKPNEDDARQIEEIDRRMLRLRDLASEEELQIAELALGEAAQKGEPESEVKPEPVVKCETCEAMPPPGHHNPEGWLKGHVIQHKTKGRRGRPKGSKNKVKPPSEAQTNDLRNSAGSGSG